MELTIRPAQPADAPAIVALYAPLVRESSVSFELEPPDAPEIEARIRRAQAHSAYLVAEQGERFAGYAYGSALRARAAYAWSIETSVYVAADQQRRGVGRRLMEALLEEATRQGFRNAFAGVTLPNDPSVALHASLGFEPVGVYRRVGFKFGRWHDVAWSQRPLGEGDPEAPAGAPPGPG